MSLIKPQILALLPAAFLAIAGCASTQQWKPDGSNREDGLVRLSVNYPKAQKPELNAAQAAELAEKRCLSWGYERAEEIAGFLRQCSEADGNSCKLWTVTREYQCRDAGSLTALANAP